MTSSSKGLIAVVSIIVLCGAAAGAYVLYRPPSATIDDEVMERVMAPLTRCVDMVRLKDDYALFEDNKRRISQWCSDHENLFTGDAEQRPDPSEITEAEKREVAVCIGGIHTKLGPPYPLRTIEDIFDEVSAIQFAKTQCYHDHWQRVKARGEPGATARE